MGVFPNGGFGFMFNIIPVLVMLGFVLVFGMIIVRSIQGISQWQKNNESPVLTVDASVVTKRTKVDTYYHNAGPDNMNQMSSTSTTYYATFEVPSGDRMEFKVSSSEYGLLAEQDQGRLTFQGTRYLGFERNKSLQEQRGTYHEQ